MTKETDFIKHVRHVAAVVLWDYRKIRRVRKTELSETVASWFFDKYNALKEIEEVYYKTH
jgi:hypothetical protein